MSKQAINTYYNKLDKSIRYGGTSKESAIRKAFSNLLDDYCENKNLELVEELNLKDSAKHPDGTLRDASRLDWGYWESKDTDDVLDEEILKKTEIGYPTFNILYEDSETAILIQEDKEVLRGSMKDADFLHQILTAFVGYERPEIADFNRAVEQFKEDIPAIVETLRAEIEKQAKTNEKFKQAREKFLELCKESINPDITAFDIREMLIQHILTEEIFNTVFDDADFHKSNNIGIELDNVVNTFLTRELHRNIMQKIKIYYNAIKQSAASITDHHHKQEFLKKLYENFYKAYNPKGADKLGVVYTPNEIVKFMIESTDYLLEKHFNKQLHDKNVEILDPATGTGTYITDLIEYIPSQYLEYKYKNEIHCNELAILPYYIANLNIEYTYQQKMSKYVPFKNIVFVDTLDNIKWFEKTVEMTVGSKYYSSGNLFGFNAENLDRIKKQNEKKISVIIGNPPYNANQMNENDNNKNREYNFIDKRIKDTYIKQSTAQKTKVYDMYSRFFRWASDRIDKDGIICFITNNSYINSRTFDGFRKSIENEFDYAYFIDLGGNIRELSGKDGIFLGEKHTIFGLGAMVGISIAFLVKKENQNKKCKIHYIHPCDIRATRKEKFEFLQETKFKNISFENIKPDKHNNWINLADNDFDTFIPLQEKNNKQTIFAFSSLGVSTNRDEWVSDFNKQNLTNKIKYFINKYNYYLKNKDLSWKTEIKWSRDLKKKFEQNKKIKFREDLFFVLNYRPFAKQNWYGEKILNDILTQNHYDIFGKDLNKANLGISINKNERDDRLLAVNQIYDLHYTGDSQLLPLFRYNNKGNQIDNITDWGLKQYTEHYKNNEITKENIFNYTYGVLHNPAYRKKYELNLKREFPRLPFYKDFFKWVNWGKELMDLHINYETVEPYKLKKIKAEKQKVNPKAKLRHDKETHDIILDENTTLKGVPDIAWDYKLGNRSAIEWILDQYKEKKPRDKTIAEKFNTYKFADYKDKVIDLIRRVTTVSVKTMEIVNQMSTEEPHKE